MKKFTMHILTSNRDLILIQLEPSINNILIFEQDDQNHESLHKNSS